MLVEPLPYEQKLQTRSLEQVDLIVIHCTELPDLATAREYGERVLYPSGTGNSGHYYIDRDGATVRYIEPTFVAHHVRGYNERSIGIELVNVGRWPDWLAKDRQQMAEAYTDAQIAGLIELVHGFQLRLPKLKYIAGHEDLDTGKVPASDDANVLVSRKLDPGPLFPWDKVLANVSLERLKP